jgi:hypothetical protein
MHWLLNNDITTAVVEAALVAATVAGWTGMLIALQS